MLFGAALWLLNLELIARVFYPWFLQSSELSQGVLHAGTYGLPLALFYAGAQRREAWPQRPLPPSSGVAGRAG